MVLKDDNEDLAVSKRRNVPPLPEETKIIYKITRQVYGINGNKNIFYWSTYLFEDVFFKYNFWRKPEL